MPTGYDPTDPDQPRRADRADTCAVGDDDPTDAALYLEGYLDGDDLCPVKHVVDGTVMAQCTRSGRHAGQHVAGTGLHVAAVWPQEATS